MTSLLIILAIAGFAGEDRIQSKHLLEAIAYRQKSHQC